MNRTQLEHIIRAAGAIAGTDDLIIIGSQAILGAVPDAPAELLVSREVDLYPTAAPEKAVLVDAAIGEGSLFDEEFGYYAHGVGPETATLPACWRERLVPVCNPNTRGVTGRCLHPVDLAVSKLMAGRDKDLAFVRVLLRHGVVAAAVIGDLAAELPAAKRPALLERLRLCTASG